LSGEVARLAGPIVVTCPELRHCVDLDAMYDHAGKRHAILDAHIALLRTCAHLSQPRASKGGALQRRIEALPLVVHPILLVDHDAIPGLVRDEIIPEALLCGNGQRILEGEIASSAILPGIHIVVAPMSIVHLHAPIGGLVEGLESIGESVTSGFPIRDASALALGVPPAVEEKRLVRNLLLLRVGVHVEESFFVSFVRLPMVLVIRAVVCGVAQVLERGVGLRQALRAVHLHEGLAIASHRAIDA